MIKRLLLSLPFLVLALSCSAAEDVAQNYAVGTDYEEITPAIRTASPGKIEVAEFFWYGCPHCYHFEPLVQQWKKTIPDDVSFRAIPAVWRDVMELHSKAFYTAQALGVLEAMHPILFQAMNVDRKRLDSQEEIKKLFTANGVSGEDFDKTFDSFGVNSQVRQAISTAKSAHINGTPALMVNGKYYISAGKAGGQAEMLKVADFLVAKERAAQGG